MKTFFSPHSVRFARRSINRSRISRSRLLSSRRATLSDHHQDFSNIVNLAGCRSTSERNRHEIVRSSRSLLKMISFCFSSLQNLLHPFPDEIHQQPDRLFCFVSGHSFLADHRETNDFGNEREKNVRCFRFPRILMEVNGFIF